VEILVFIQSISILGAILVLGAYAAHQLQRLSSKTAAYQLMNLFGGFFLFIAALESRQAGLIAIEGAWTLVSGYGLWRVGKR
jgi:hypothetical protein